MKKNMAALALSLFAFSASAADQAAIFDAKSCKADYPKASLLNEEQGTVTASFLVSAEGKVVDSKLEKSSGFKNLDSAALKSIAACKFKPGTKDGKAEQGWTKVAYVWALG